MPSARYLELQSRLHQKQDDLADYLANGRGGDGMYSGVDKAEAERRERELDDLADELKRLDTLESLEERHAKARDERRQPSSPMVHAGPRGSGAPGRLSHTTLGEMVKDAWGKHQHAGRKALDQEFDCDVKAWLGLDVGLKATMLTTAGWAPESTRIPRIADKIAAPLEVLDLFPVQTTDQPSIPWMEETTSTNAATEIAEAALYPESALAFTERTSTVRKIGTRIPVSDEQLADVPGMAQVIDGRLRFFVQKRLDLQVIAGDGIAPNLLGILNTPSVQVQATGADPDIEAIYKGIVKVRVVGQSNPTSILVHPNDFQDIRLLHTTDGIYIFGSPADGGPVRLWGLPVTETAAVPEGTALIGDFTQSTLWIRQSATVEIGYVDTQFNFGLQTIRASLRAALSIYRAQAFCMVTGL
jgi:HK97 family phage major capsid protein